MGDGFVASVKVRNLSMFYATDSWVVTVDLPRGRIANAWNAIPGGTSPQTFTPAPWSPVVGLTGSTEFGFLASGSPDDAALTCAWP
ncbi:cellulose binding domain-containing protein [Cellulomonas flavigena]|uniref:cellulose binding domain-containing protein n=1 Tax=Cellulomonas flavigena TaxID=1711 RepID=UPI0005BDC3E8|nr:cellulose binding domain-containing protein [Cellulomonas flavigena]